EWRFTYLNREAERMLRRSRQQLLGKVLCEEFEGLAGTVFEREYRRAVETQEPIVFEERYEPYELWVEVHAYPSDEGLAIYLRDITQRKLAEIALHQSEENLRLAVTAAGLGVWHWNIVADSL